MVHNVTGVILAGGAGKRFKGITKAMIVVDGRTIISRIIDVYRSIFEEIIIVTNTPEEFLDFADNCIITGDIFLNKGPLGGVHSALTESTRDSVFIVGSDMPFLDKNIILSQINFFEKNNCDCIIPSIGKHIEPLHGIYNKSTLRSLEEYLRLDNNYAIREFFKRIEVCYFQVEDSENSRMAFTNINTQSDLRSVNKNHDISSSD